jgi:hypothetical protein
MASPEWPPMPAPRSHHGAFWPIGGVAADGAAPSVRGAPIW